MTLNFNIWPTLLVHVCVNTHSHTQNIKYGGEPSEEDIDH